MPSPDYAKAKRIRDLKAEGLTQQQVADELGVTQTAIVSMSRTHNIIWDKTRRGDQSGTKNHQYKNGLGKSTIERLTYSIVVKSGRCPKTCERCGNFNVEQDQHRHHKDRDRSNNVTENIEVLCTTCHNKEHLVDRQRGTNGQFEA